jgi:hypothetical protein
MKSSYAIVIAIALLGSLAACKPTEPKADIVKTQRDALQKAKDVSAVQQKSADEQQKQSDEATK